MIIWVWVAYKKGYPSVELNWNVIYPPYSVTLVACYELSQASAFLNKMI